MEQEANRPVGRIAFFESPDIYTIGADGKGLRQITNGPHLNYCPRFSRDGHKLVFAAGILGATQIYSINADGTDLRQLTDCREMCIYPCYSPDGESIAFITSSGQGWMVHLMNADGSDVRQTTSPVERCGTYHNPIFTADGRSIIYEGSGLQILDLGSGEVRPFLSQGPEGYDAHEWLDVSSSGRKIAFVAATCQEHEENDYEWVYTVYIGNFDGSNLLNITEGFFTAHSPAISPCSDYVAYVGRQQRESRSRIYIVRPDGSEVSSFELEGMAPNSLSWAPDVTPSGVW